MLSSPFQLSTFVPAKLLLFTKISSFARVELAHQFISGAFHGDLGIACSSHHLISAAAAAVQKGILCPSNKKEVKSRRNIH